MLLKVFVRNVYFGGYLKETRHAFIVYMFRRRPEVLHSVGDNALISRFGKGPITSCNPPECMHWTGHTKIDWLQWLFSEPHGGVTCKSVFFQCLQRHVATEIWVNIGSGYGLVPDDTKPLPEPMLTIISEGSAWVIKFNGPSGDSGQRGPYSQWMKLPDMTKSLTKLDVCTFHF